MSSLLTFDDVIYKAPNEIIRNKGFDFADEIPSGDTIEAVGSNTDVTAVDQDGTDASSTILENDEVSGTILRTDIKAGTAGNDYLVTYKVKTGTSTDVFHKFLLVRVRSRGIVA
jgi:hypothetical protein